MKNLILGFVLFLVGCAGPDMNEIKIQLDSNRDELIEYWKKNGMNSDSKFILQCKGMRRSQLIDGLIHPIDFNSNPVCPMEGPHSCHDEDSDSGAESIAGVGENGLTEDYEIEGDIIMICHPVRPGEND